MGDSIWDLFARLGIDTTGFQKGVDGAVNKSQTGQAQIGSSFQGISNAAKTMAGAMGIAFGAVQVVKFFGDAKTSASNLNETLSKSQVVFGEFGSSVIKMGENAARSMGMSKNEAVAAAATYGNLFVSMGLVKDKSAEMSTNLVQLAADFASFNNIPVAEALEKIKAGLLGQGEPMASLGVIINENTLRQEALNLGLKVGTGVLDGAVKAQAAYSLMLKQSSTAQGDFARTADGVANSERINAAEIENLTASIGEGLLPVYGEFLKLANGAVSILSKVVTANSDAAKIIKDHATEVGKSSKTYAEYTKEVRANALSIGILITDNGDLVTKTGQVIATNAMATQAQYDLTRAIETGSIAAQKWIDEGTDWISANDRVTKAIENTTLAEFANSGQTDRWVTDWGRKKQATDDLYGSIGKYVSALKDIDTQQIYNLASEGMTLENKLKLKVAMGLMSQEAFDAQMAITNLSYFGNIAFDTVRVAAQNAAAGIAAADTIANGPHVYDTTISISGMVFTDYQAYSDWLWESSRAADGMKDKTATLTTDIVTNYKTNGVPVVHGNGPIYAQAEGGDYMVNKPTLFLAGEAGQERATFTPAGKGGMDGGNDVTKLLREIAQKPEINEYRLAKLVRDAVLQASPK